MRVYSLNWQETIIGDIDADRVEYVGSIRSMDNKTDKFEVFLFNRVEPVIIQGKRDIVAKIREDFVNFWKTI